MKEDIVLEIIRINDELGVTEMIWSLEFFRCLEYQSVYQALELKLGMFLLSHGAGRGLLPAGTNRSNVSENSDPDSIKWQALKLPFVVNFPFRRLMPRVSGQCLRSIKLEGEDMACGICLILHKGGSYVETGV